MRQSALAFISCLLFSTPGLFCVIEVSLAQNHTPSEIAPLDPEVRQAILQFAQEITVQIITDNNKGSGTLMGKQGNDYLVLTNAHVVNYMRVPSEDK